MLDRVFSRDARVLLQRGLDLLFPPRCAGCRRGGFLLCPACWQTMQPLMLPLCEHCGALLSEPAEGCSSCRYKRLQLHGLRHVSLYQGPLRKTIHAFKYDGQLRLAEPLGLLLAEAFRLYGLKADGVLPLPLHPQRLRQRGYNQAALLARVCATHLKIPYLEDLVIRQRLTCPQVGLAFSERQHNVAGAFTLTSSAHTSLRGYHTLLLIDDVSTTGATLEACAAPLYAAGIQQVWGLVLGKPANLMQDGSKGML
ncbi:MAG TPA: ComF family protein [Ktedonobacteraceae bacterium]